MAILCLSENILDLKERLDRIIIGYNYQGQPVTAKDLKAGGAMAAVPQRCHPSKLGTNLRTYSCYHPRRTFANIAHGCNSVLATKLALKYADYVVTEAGFGADLGAEKFIDIKCRIAGLKPAAVVPSQPSEPSRCMVELPKQTWHTENVQAVIDGLPNLDKHLANIQEVYGLPVVVAINKFPLDTEAELEAVYESCKKRHVDVVISDVWANMVELVVVTWLKKSFNWLKKKTTSLMSMTKKTALKQN